MFSTTEKIADAGRFVTRVFISSCHIGLSHRESRDGIMAKSFKDQQQTKNASARRGHRVHEKEHRQFAVALDESLDFEEGCSIKDAGAINRHGVNE